MKVTLIRDSSDTEYNHRAILNDLEQKLLLNNFLVKTKQNYRIDIENKTLNGEIDLLAFHPIKKIILAIEVKSKKSQGSTCKAYHQLIKDLFYVQSTYPGFSVALMFAYGKIDENEYRVEKCRKGNLRLESFV